MKSTSAITASVVVNASVPAATSRKQARAVAIIGRS